MSNNKHKQISIAQSFAVASRKSTEKVAAGNHQWTFPGFNTFATTLDGKGNCMFAALAHQLFIVGIEKQHHTSYYIRQQLVTFLQSDQQLAQQIAQTLQGETITAYIARLGKDGEWGDGNMLSLACKLYNCRIYIYTEGNSKPACIDVDEQTQVNDAPLTLGFVKETPADDEPNHYISLVLIDGQSSLPASEGYLTGKLPDCPDNNTSAVVEVDKLYMRDDRDNIETKRAKIDGQHSVKTITTTAKAKLKINKQQTNKQHKIFCQNLSLVSKTSSQGSVNSVSGRTQHKHFDQSSNIEAGTSTTTSSTKQQSLTSASIAKTGNISEQATNLSEWYKGHKLNVEWLCEANSETLKKVKVNKRAGLKCTICCEHITEACKFSRNGTVPLADGVRCDGIRELRRVVDHLLGDVHQASVRANDAQKLWSAQSDSHPWVRVLKNYQSEIVSSLIALAIDVHNDSKQLTLSAHSWPARSLAQMHAANQISQYKEHGLDADFMPFQPPSAALHYRDPNIYRQMLQIVADVVMEQIVKEIKAAECFSIQVDGSVDKYSVDNKFITARYMDANKGLHVIFLAEAHSKKRGSDGLLDAVVETFKDLGLEETAKEKLIGLTTDGESANTGRKAGLWAKMRMYLNRDLICFWCAAHRADLLFGDIETTVSEVRHWKSNVKATATYFRASGVRTAELVELCNEAGIQFMRFPEHFEVRFIEHLVNLCRAVWSNLPCMRKHWQHIAESGERTEKQTATGFLKLWNEDGEQEYMTALMLDVLQVLQNLQQKCQASMATICDIITAKNHAQRALALMESAPYPGGVEEKYAQLRSCTLHSMELETEEVAVRSSKRKHSLVTKARNRSSIRQEVILSAKNLMDNRLDDEQNEVVVQIKDVLDARSEKQMIDSSRSIVCGLFGDSNLSSFADNVIAQFTAGKLPVPSDVTDSTGKLYYLLSLCPAGSILSKLVQSFVISSPHSCGPERVVSCHTILKTSKRSSLSRETVNSRLRIAINTAGTAHFDPRPAVARFLTTKSRRASVPDAELYRDREFVKKFFAADSVV